MLTATAAVRLWERGAFDLDRPISDILPVAPRTDVTITPRLLAGHLAGIRHYDRAEYVSQVAYPDVGASISRFIDDSLVASPGTRYSYSSYGYNLLGWALESATGREFRDIIRENVTSPLGVSRILPSERDGVSQEVTYYTRSRSGELDEAPFVDLSDRWPSGGYVGTAGDLARFGSVAFRESSDAGRNAMLTPMQTPKGAAAGVAIGWRVGTDSRGQRIAHHGGDAMGSRAFLLAYPDENLAVAIVANLNFAPIGEKEAARITQLLFW